MRSNIEDVVPGLAEARRAERLNRALAFAGVTRTLAGVEILPMTPAHRLTLQLLGTAFAPFVEGFKALAPALLDAWTNLSPLSLIFQVLAPVIPVIGEAFFRMVTSGQPQERRIAFFTGIMA